MVKRTILLTSLVMILALFAVPALAQDTTFSSGAATDQYPTEDAAASSVDAAIQSVRDVIGEQGEDMKGAEAYAAALNAARDTGVDEETAEVVAAKAVAEVSKELEEPEITELPDTGGAPYSVLVGGFLVVGGLLARRVLR